MVNMIWSDAKKPLYSHPFHKRGTNVYHDPRRKRREHQLVFQLKSKFLTPRMYLIDRLRQKKEDDIVYWEKEEDLIFKIAHGTFRKVLRDFRKSCLKKRKRNARAEDYFNQQFPSGGSSQSQYILASAKTPLKTYYMNRVDYFLDMGSMMDWIIQMLLEGIDKEYLEWTNEKEKIFKINTPEQLHELFNKASVYHKIPQMTYNEFKYQLRGYCHKGVMKEVAPYTYQFDVKWYLDEIYNTH